MGLSKFFGWECGQCTDSENTYARTYDRTNAPAPAMDVPIEADRIPGALPPAVEPDVDKPVKKRMMRKRKSNNFALDQKTLNKRHPNKRRQPK
jgi:hypothetical protein